MPRKIPKFNLFCTEFFVFEFLYSRQMICAQINMINYFDRVHDVGTRCSNIFHDTVDMTILLTFSNLSSNKVFRVDGLLLYTFRSSHCYYYGDCCRQCVWCERVSALHGPSLRGLVVAHSSLSYILYEHRICNGECVQRLTRAVAIFIRKPRTKGVRCKSFTCIIH